MPRFDDYNPFVQKPPEATNLLVLQREREKTDKARAEVKAAISQKCKQIGPIQLPLPSIRRKSA